MKAQVFYQKQVLKLEERAVPSISENEVLIKVMACGICGSDISYYYGKSPLDTENGLGPLVLGHEFSGVIVDLGAEAQKKGALHKGDRVTVNPPLHCNSCEMCTQGYPNLCTHLKPLGTAQDGAFAEYVKAPATHTVKLPDEISFEEGAMIEPFACALHGVKLLDSKLGSFVIIFGTGAIGLMMLQVLRALGAGKIAVCGIIDHPLQLAEKLGADYIFNINDKESPYYTEDIRATIESLTRNKMADRAIVAVSDIEAMQNALAVTGLNATIVYFGLPGEQDFIRVPALASLKSAKTIRFSWLSPLMWPEALRTVQEKKVCLQDLITNYFRLEELESAIQYMAGTSPDKIKGMVKF